MSPYIINYSYKNMASTADDHALMIKTISEIVQ